MSTNRTSFRKTLADVGDDGVRRPMRADIKSFYGLTAPYDFTRATPFVAAIVLFLIIIAAMGAAASFGKLHWGTYRFIYFVYIGSTALLAIALSFAPRLAWPLVALSFIDFSLGISTGVLAHADSGRRSILPLDNSRLEFTYHPLLQGTPTPNFTGFMPVKTQHDSHGLRGSERDKDRLKQQIVIAAVGGSTTYDMGVAEGQTWPDVLERELGKDYAVLNHGVLAYSTVENLLQTLFYLEPYGVTPRCAIYYVGWNDIRNAHLPNLDPAYADFHLLDKVNWLQTRRKPLLAEISPLSAIVVSYLQRWVDTVPTAEDVSGLAPAPGSDTRLEKIFRRNLEAIEAVNKQRGITSIFVGQVLNRAQLRDTDKHVWWPLVRDTDVWPLQARFNAILKETAEALGSPAFVPPIDEFQDSDFVDKGHFSVQGSRKFATMLAPLVRAYCTR
jgi:lysophospholipase L1-like esterase